MTWLQNFFLLIVITKLRYLMESNSRLGAFVSFSVLPFLHLNKRLDWCWTKLASSRWILFFQIPCFVWLFSSAANALFEIQLIPSISSNSEQKIFKSEESKKKNPHKNWNNSCQLNFWNGVRNKALHLVCVLKARIRWISLHVASWWMVNFIVLAFKRNNPCITPQLVDNFRLN